MYSSAIKWVLTVIESTPLMNVKSANVFCSYLRSMTALLDPVQMEERERRRQKQLEQQVRFRLRT